MLNKIESSLVNNHQFLSMVSMTTASNSPFRKKLSRSYNSHDYLDRLPTRAKLARQLNCLFVVFDIKLESSLKKFKNKYNVK